MGDFDVKDVVIESAGGGAFGAHLLKTSDYADGDQLTGSGQMASDKFGGHEKSIPIHSDEEEEQEEKLSSKVSVVATVVAEARKIKDTRPLQPEGLSLDKDGADADPLSIAQDLLNQHRMICKQKVDEDLRKFSSESKGKKRRWDQTESSPRDKSYSPPALEGRRPTTRRKSLRLELENGLTGSQLKKVNMKAARNGRIRNSSRSMQKRFRSVSPSPTRKKKHKPGQSFLEKDDDYVP